MHSSYKVPCENHDRQLFLKHVLERLSIFLQLFTNIVPPPRKKINPWFSPEKEIKYWLLY